MAQSSHACCSAADSTFHLPDISLQLINLFYLPSAAISIPGLSIFYQICCGLFFTSCRKVIFFCFCVMSLILIAKSYFVIGFELQLDVAGAFSHDRAVFLRTSTYHWHNEVHLWFFSFFFRLHLKNRLMTFTFCLAVLRPPVHHIHRLECFNRKPIPADFGQEMRFPLAWSPSKSRSWIKKYKLPTPRSDHAWTDDCVFESISDLKCMSFCTMCTQ